MHWKSFNGVKKKLLNKMEKKYWGWDQVMQDEHEGVPHYFINNN